MDVRRIVTVPIWESRTAAEGELVLRINVGRGGGIAFGFGAHPTTTVSLALLGGLYRPGGPRPSRILDVGCGSGVLGIACARLGAAEVLGVDIAPEAVAMSAENAATNGVAGVCRYQGTAAADVPGTFDLVVANLPSSVVLRELAPAISARAGAGLIILSGFVEQYREVVLAAFAALGRNPRAEAVHAGWCGALLR